MASVDVVVPCYNYARYLRDCVGSILTQEGVDVRVLIIDDCSKDETPEVGAELAASDSRVEFRRHAVNQRNIATYNEGLMGWAKADYCTLVSADDMLVPGSLARATRVLDAHPEVGLAYGRVIKHYDGKPLPQPKITSTECSYKVYPGLEWLENLIKDHGHGIVTPEVVVRTRVQHQVGGYNPQLPHSGDIELWTRFALTGAIAYLDAEQAIYRQHGTNMHIERDSAILNVLTDRRNAFRLGFAACGDGRPEHRRLEELSNHCLAAHALWKACHAFDYDQSARLPYRDLLAFAREVYPRSRTWRIYWTLRLRMLFGQGGWRTVRRLAFWKNRAVPA
jgi:glycosyltransferase involved in cell wall biosynthesis